MTTKTTKSATSVKPHKKKPSWDDVKSVIAKLERPALISLISDLYAYSTPNKNFLHARYSIGSDALKPYKKIIDVALYPNVMSKRVIALAESD